MLNLGFDFKGMFFGLDLLILLIKLYFSPSFFVIVKSENKYLYPNEVPFKNRF